MSFSLGFYFFLFSAAGLATAQTPAPNYCGWPGKPWGGSFNISSGVAVPIITPDQLYPPGTTITYQCRNGQFDLIRGSVNRVCQEDGRWNGSLPWCDINVAFGKMVRYSANDGMTKTDSLMTDGLINTEDPENTAECPALSKTTPFFEIDLQQEYAVRFVAIFGSDGKLDNLNQMTTKVMLNTYVCNQRSFNKTSLLYGCIAESTQINPQGITGKAIRFEHSNIFSINVCEVLVYVNPSFSDCGEPEIPANGMVSVANMSSYQEARYSCKIGYEIRGNEMRRCSGRQWDGYPPICVETLTSTSPMMNTTDVPDVGPPSAGLGTVQIVLIVLCVLLFIGLVIALVFLFKSGRLNCCGGSKKGEKNWKSTTPTEYQQVQNPETTAIDISPVVETNVTSSAPEEPKVIRTSPVNKPRAPDPVEDVINTALAVPEKVIYANEPVRRTSGSVENTENPTYANYSPIYSKVVAKNRPTSVAASAEVSPGSTASGAEGSSRKSYIPLVYRMEPENQMKHQALNDQLKDAVRKVVHEPARETDF